MYFFLLVFRHRADHAAAKQAGIAVDGGSTSSVSVALDNSFETLQLALCWRVMLSREAMLRKLHLRDEYYRRRARGSFAEFIRYTKPDYQLSWFHEELASELEQFLEDVIEKRSPRLIINIPPQEGKSEQVSRRFPAYALGRDPNLRMVACGYSATLALQFSRDVHHHG